MTAHGFPPLPLHHCLKLAAPSAVVAPKLSRANQAPRPRSGGRGSHRVGWVVHWVPGPEGRVGRIPKRMTGVTQGDEIRWKGPEHVEGQHPQENSIKLI